MDLRLTSEQSNALLEILEERDRTLLEKISHAKREAPKKGLQDKEMLLESIIEKLVVKEQEFTDLWW